MPRFTFHQIVKFAALVFLLFLIGVCKVLLTLDSVELGSHSKPQCIEHTDFYVDKVKDMQDEIDMLKDQIRELQQIIFTKRRNKSVMTKSKKMSHKCLNELDFGSKASKTNANFISERHVPMYTRFDMWHQYYEQSAKGDLVRDKLNGLQRNLIDEVIDEAVLQLNSSGWRRDHFVEGIFKTSDTIGTHYELHFKNDNGHKKRVTLFRPQAPPIALDHNPILPSNVINIVVPLSGRGRSFQVFLANYEKLLVETNYKIFLTIVYFGDSIKELMYIFQPFLLKHKYRLHHVEHVKDRNFSRGYALDTGIRSWKGKTDPLMFLCDVDVIFNNDFLDRCQAFSERQRVYYPIVFSLYNPKVIELYFNQQFTSLADKLKVTSDHGFWRDFGYGMVCLYRSDYLQSGGFNLNIHEWGKEDVLLFRKFARSNMTVIRAPDPDIFHLWHHKSCNATLSDEHYRACIKSKILNEGSYLQLGYMVLRDEINQRRRTRFEHL